MACLGEHGQRLRQQTHAVVDLIAPKSAIKRVKYPLPLDDLNT